MNHFDFCNSNLKSATITTCTVSETSPNAKLLNLLSLYGNAKTQDQLLLSTRDWFDASLYKHGNDHYNLCLEEKFVADPIKPILRSRHFALCTALH